MLRTARNAVGEGSNVEDSGRDFVQSLERGLEVIRSFSEESPPVGSWWSFISGM